MAATYVVEGPAAYLLLVPVASVRVPAAWLQILFQARSAPIRAVPCRPALIRADPCRFSSYGAPSKARPDRVVVHAAATKLGPGVMVTKPEKLLRSD